MGSGMAWFGSKLPVAAAGASAFALGAGALALGALSQLLPGMSLAKSRGAVVGEPDFAPGFGTRGCPGWARALDSRAEAGDDLHALVRTGCVCNGIRELLGLRPRWASGQ